MDVNEKTIKVGILTVSDTRSRHSDGETFDSSGHELKELINRHNVIESATVVEYDIVTDDLEKIQEKMIEWCSKGKVDVLLSTGGTGLSPRDVTPEATLGLVQRLTFGISQAILNESLKITPMAMLSRAVSGIYEKTLIINLPGSVKAAKECLLAVASTIPHAVNLMKDQKEISKRFHDQLNSKNNDKLKVPECVTKVACRYRESPYPKISMASALTIIKEVAVSQYNENYKIMYPTVWIFSTGDELKSNEDDGYIRDTNSLMIKQLLAQDKYMGSVYNRGIFRDNWYDLCKQFEEAFDNADIIVSSGGVSMGENDLIKHVLEEHFSCYIHFGRVDMKPGMPSTFATLSYKGKKKYIFCFPGNPVSAGVCTHLFLLPYLRSVSGRKSIVHSFKAEITHSIYELDARPEYKRALFQYDDGIFYVSCLTNNQLSSRLMSFVGANCLLTLPSSKTQASIEEGTIMDIILINGIENIYDAPLFNRLLIQFPHGRPKADVFMSFKNLLEFITSKCILQFENILTSSAMGYVLYTPVYAPEDLPPYQASIKDGYAIKYGCLNVWSQDNIFEVVQVSVAGTEPNSQEEISENKCARVSTGAPIPPGANCVVQVEDTSILSISSDETQELTINILKEPKAFENIRPIGSDIHVGQCLLEKKYQLGPFEIALLRSVGCDNVEVYKYPAIHIITLLSDMSCGTHIMIKNILKQNDYKGNIKTHYVPDNLVNIVPFFNENVLENHSIIIFVGNGFNVRQPGPLNFKTHIKVENKSQDGAISFEFGEMQFQDCQFVFFNITNTNSKPVYNCVHLFILPFLRFCVGKSQIISSVKAKSIIKASISQFELAELDYKDGDFNVTCFGVKGQNCIVAEDSPECHSNPKGITCDLNVVVTENSDFYLIDY